MTFRVLAAWALAGVAGVSLVAQEPQIPGKLTPSPIPRVASFDDLRPTAPEDRLLAERLGGDGSSMTPRQLFERGGDIFVTTGHSRNYGWFTGYVVLPCELFIATQPGPPCDPVENERIQTLELQRKMVCNSDGVAVGRVTDQRVFLSQNEKALWTRYRAEIRRWVYPSAGPDEITLAHGGGTVDVSGVMVSMSSGSIATNQLFLLQLERIPGTTAFRSYETLLPDSDAFGSDVTAKIAWAVKAATGCRR